MPFGIPDTRQFPWDQSLSNNLQQLTNKTTGGINTWAVNPTVGVDGLALGTNHEGYTGVNTTTNTLVRWNGTAWVMVMDTPKLVTTPKLVLYVSQNTGSDTNNGLTAGTAWKTISKLYQELMQYNFLERQVDIHLGAGTYVVRFPPTMIGFPIRIFGASSSSVTIQRLDVSGGQNVSIDGVTISFPLIPDNVYYYLTVMVSNSSFLYIGKDVVFGPMGNFQAGRNIGYLTAMSGSYITFFANAPVTITGNVNTFCTGNSTSSIMMRQFTPNVTSVAATAPPINNGSTYNLVGEDMNSTHTMTTFNCIGNLSIGTFFGLSGGTRMNPGRSVVTGNVTGVAYALYDASYINTGVVRGTPPEGVGYLGFPASMSSGTKDATSQVYGPTF